MGPPPALEKMWLGASLVVRVKVLTQGKPMLDPTASDPLVIRHPTAQVLETFKTTARAAVGDTVTLFQVGGTLMANGKDVTTVSSEPLLEPGEDAILFLKSVRDGGFVSAYGGGVFPIDPSTGDIAVPALDRRVSDFGGRATVPRDDVLRVLRALRDRRPLTDWP
jgi:hypothetical protein